VLVSAGLALSLVSAGRAEAANYYAAVDIRNPTDVTLYYSFRWGPDAAWQNYSVGPRQVQTHFWGYAYADQNGSPTPQVRFHYNPGATYADYKTYDLQAYAVPYRTVGVGVKYVFRYSRGGRYLDLYKE
jgi:hypothetical protein